MNQPRLIIKRDGVKAGMEFEREFGHMRYAVGKQDRDEILDQLMLTYGKDIWNYAYFLTRRRDLAEDIAQDVFIKAYRNMNTFRGTSSVKSWLFSIARRTTLDYMKSAWMRKVTLLPSQFLQDAHPSAETEWLCREEQREVWRAVMELPRKQRETLLLYAHYKFSIREIAELLELTEGTVKSRLHRARAAMNRRLDAAARREERGS